jgi:hypothetical protein
MDQSFHVLGVKAQLPSAKRIDTLRGIDILGP